MPTGRSQDLGDVLTGVVVRGSKGTDALLESAWDGAASERFGVELLTPLVPRKEQDTLELLRVAAVRLELAAKENLGLVPWMAPLAADLRTVRSPTRRLPLLLGPHGPDAGVLVPTSEGIEIRGSSDGSSLSPSAGTAGSSDSESGTSASGGVAGSSGVFVAGSGVGSVGVGGNGVGSAISGSGITAGASGSGASTPGSGVTGSDAPGPRAARSQRARSMLPT